MEITTLSHTDTMLCMNKGNETVLYHSCQYVLQEDYHDVQSLYASLLGFMCASEIKLFFFMHNYYAMNE